MNDIKLLLKFEIAGDSRLHVKRATRIKVDGRGGLVLYSSLPGATETINLSQLQSFCIQPLTCGTRAVSAA
jgi:hypothetical protein